MIKTLAEIKAIPIDYKLCPECEMINSHTNIFCIACQCDIEHVTPGLGIVNRVDDIVSEIGDEPLEV